MLTRRDALSRSLAAGLIGGVAGTGPALAMTQPGRMIDRAVPITAAERAGRIEKAQGMMRNRKIAGLLLEPGAAMEYFTGLRWWRSERLTAVIIPAEGEIAIVTPGFEERSIREHLGNDTDVRIWQEHESPFGLVGSVLNDRDAKGSLALEASVRFFVVQGLRKSVSRRLVDGRIIVNGCRVQKSDAEIALMQIANDITYAAYAKTANDIRPGMTPKDIKAIFQAATRAEGGTPTFTLALLNEASSYPHGSDQPQTVTEQTHILMDCGCDVHGYKSDISRTWVLGDPTPEQTRVWNTALEGQKLALETAKIGTPAGQVDEAVRAFYAREGFGPGYQAPGLTHRLGHGIGMEVHEDINFVQGENTPLAPGMCLSNEPGIYIPGTFGIRLEDCLYMTETGPKLFSPLTGSITDPVSTA